MIGIIDKITDIAKQFCEIHKNEEKYNIQLNWVSESSYVTALMRKLSAKCWSYIKIL